MFVGDLFLFVVICCSWFVGCPSLFDVRCRCLLFVGCDLLFVVGCSLCVVCGLMFGVAAT